MSIVLQRTRCVWKSDTSVCNCITGSVYKGVYISCCWIRYGIFSCNNYFDARATNWFEIKNRKFRETGLFTLIIVKLYYWNWYEYSREITKLTTHVFSLLITYLNHVDSLIIHKNDYALLHGKIHARIQICTIQLIYSKFGRLSKIGNAVKIFAIYQLLVA